MLRSLVGSEMCIRDSIYAISELQPNMPFVQIKGHFLHLEIKQIGKRKQCAVGTFTDGVRVCDIIWFNAIKYISSTISIDKEYIIFGRPTAFSGRIQFTHPEVEEATELQLNNMGMQPFYITCLLYTSPSPRDS